MEKKTTAMFFKGKQSWREMQGRHIYCLYQMPPTSKYSDTPPLTPVNTMSSKLFLTLHWLCESCFCTAPSNTTVGYIGKVMPQFSGRATPMFGATATIVWNYFDMV